MGIIKALNHISKGDSPKVNEDFIVAKTVKDTENIVKALGGPTHEVTVELAGGKSGTARGYSESQATGWAYKDAKSKK